MVIKIKRASIIPALLIPPTTRLSVRWLTLVPATGSEYITPRRVFAKTCLDRNLLRPLFTVRIVTDPLIIQMHLTVISYLLPVFPANAEVNFLKVKLADFFLVRDIGLNLWYTHRQLTSVIVLDTKYWKWATTQCFTCERISNWNEIQSTIHSW